jgi:PPOX class probable F420-dependent enzyme
MTAEESAAMLASSRRMQLATINPDGTPHLVAVFYMLRAGNIAFWTDRASQKAHNLARDPRLTCLVEDGDDYFELRGVQVRGVARTLDDPDTVAAIGRSIAVRLTGVPDGPAGDYVTRAARKRIAFVVEPRRIVTWDHRKLLTPG